MGAGYDTIHFWSSETPGNTSLIKDWTEHRKAQDQSYTSGHLKNLRIDYSDQGTSIKGSLSRYFHGSNCIDLTRPETHEAILSLSEVLWIPIDEAKITELHFGSNIILDHPPKAYYPYLGWSSHLIRSIYRNTLYFKNDTRQFVFYNKTAEAKKDTPSNWEGLNVIRAEMRMKKEPHKQLKRPPITGATLSEPDFFRSIQERFVSEYHSIKKIPGFQFNLESMSKPNDLFNQWLSEHISQIGIEAALQTVDELKARNKFANSKAYERAKDKIKALSQMRNRSMPSPLIEELTRKIECLL